MGPAGTFEIGREAHHLGPRPGAGAGMGDRLVTIAEPVDEFRLDRLLPQKRPAIDRGSHVVLRQFAVPSDPADDLTGNGAEQSLDLLAMRRRHLAFGQDVHRGLVLLAMIKFGDDTENVEGALEERRVGIEPGQADISQRLQPDFVERGGQIIRPGSRTELAKAVGEGQREFAFGAEIGDRIADLLNVGAAEPILADAREQHLDARVVTGGLDRIERIPQCRPGAEHQPPQGILGRAFRKLTRQVGRQDDVCGQRRYRRPQAADGEQTPGKQQHRKKADNGEKTHEQTTHPDPSDS